MIALFILLLLSVFNGANKDYKKSGSFATLHVYVKLDTIWYCFHETIHANLKNKYKS